MAKPFEMMRCEHCGDLREVTRSENNSICGDCRDDSRKSVLICGVCETREVMGESDYCSAECAAEDREAAREWEADQRMDARRERGGV